MTTEHDRFNAMFEKFLERDVTKNPGWEIKEFAFYLQRISVITRRHMYELLNREPFSDEAALIAYTTIDQIFVDDGIVGNGYGVSIALNNASLHLRETP